MYIATQKTYWSFHHIRNIIKEIIQLTIEFCELKSFPSTTFLLGIPSTTMPWNVKLWVIEEFHTTLKRSSDKCLNLGN